MVIPYGKQKIEQSDIDAVVEVLNSNFLTQGPQVKAFEKQFGERIKNPFCTALCNATSGLHVAYQALGLGQEDLLWTVPNTFVASANAAKYLGADVDFVDIDPDSFCMSISALASKLKGATKLPKIVVPVHFAGISCDMKAIYNLSLEYNFKIVEDAAHAVGGSYDYLPVGSCRYSDAAVFSFHPVKIITTGEGGIVAAKDQEVHNNIQQLITHGITKNSSEMLNTCAEPWFYEMHTLGYNYRLTDIQAALGSSQLSRLDENIKRRREIALRYQEAFEGSKIKIQKTIKDGSSAWHLFVILLENNLKRKEVFDYLHSKNIKVQVHYIPVHMQPYYKNLGFKRGDFPNSERYYEKCISLPMYHSLSQEEQDYVITTIKEIA